MNSSQPVPGFSCVIGRYALFDEIASGGMATVHLGRLLGPSGFSRTVAIKKLHAHFARDPEFVEMFLDEARLVARIQHPNVVPTLDVVSLENQLYLVMEYVQGESLSRLRMAATARGQRIPVRVALSIAVGVLDGLHAAHEARNEQGQPLGIVHRDVSPQNILVGVDGVARVLDFGVAKAAWRAQTTKDGQLKGKLAYMAPEQLTADIIDRRVDVFAAAVVLWESLTGKRLFDAESPMVVMTQIASREIERPSAVVTGLPVELDRVVMRGLARNPSDRFASTRDMAVALEAVGWIASQREVGQWVEQMAGEQLGTRARKVADIEGISTIHPRAPSRPSLLSTAPSEPIAPPVIAPSATPNPITMSFRDVGPTRRSTSIIVAAALVVIAVAVGVLALRDPATLATAVDALPPVDAVAAQLAATPPVAAPPAPTPSASAAPDPVASTPPKNVAPARRATAPAPQRPRADCNPPYTIDASGIRRPKMQCL
jgi:eukaryotic-like serine/threonine-protein kinase